MNVDVQRCATQYLFIEAQMRTFVRENLVSVWYYVAYMMKNSEMRKFWGVSREQLSQEGGEILFFHIFPVLDISSLPHRWHNMMRFFCKNSSSFQVQLFLQTVPIFCHHQSPQLITMMLLGWSPSNPFPFPSTITNLIPWVPSSSLLNMDAGSFFFWSFHPSHLPFSFSASPALLWIWTPPFSWHL